MHVARALKITLAALVAVALALALAMAGSLLTAANAAYPGRDGKIAFTRGNQVFTINADGTGAKQLTSAGKNYRPRYSPSGTEIAYIHESADGSRDVWVMRADGSGKRAVTHLASVTGPSWSPDGRQLAFGGGAGLTLQTVRRSSTGAWGTPSPVMAYACEGSGQLTALPVKGAVAWGAGNRIAFGTPNSCDSPDWGMAVVDVDYVLPTVQTIDIIGGACCGIGHFEDPSWSPDGTRLAYGVVNRANDWGKRLPDKVTVYLFGVGWQTLGSPGDKQPAYSPSSTRVAVTNTSAGSTRIVLFNSADSSGRRVLTTGYQPDWQPRP